MVTGLALPGLALALWPRLSAIDRAAAAPEAELALLRGIPLFAALPPPVLEGLAGRLRPLAVSAGRAVVSEGEPGERFYTVERGALRVSQDDAALRDLGPGTSSGRSPSFAPCHGRPR